MEKCENCGAEKNGLLQGYKKALGYKKTSTLCWTCFYENLKKQEQQEQEQQEQKQE